MYNKEEKNTNHHLLCGQYLYKALKKRWELYGVNRKWIRKIWIMPANRK